LTFIYFVPICQILALRTAKNGTKLYFQSKVFNLATEINKDENILRREFRRNCSVIYFKLKFWTFFLDFNFENKIFDDLKKLFSEPKIVKILLVQFSPACARFYKIRIFGAKKSKIIFRNLSNRVDLCWRAFNY